MNIVLLSLFVSLVYWFSVIGSVHYCDGKIYKFKLIYLITIFTPLLNTYSAIKWFLDKIFSPIIEE